MFQTARAVVLWLAVAIVAGCAGTGEPLPGGTAAVGAPPSGPEIRAMVVRLIPASVRDRSGWADDLYSAFSSLDLPHAPQVYCAAIAIIEQESSFQADPVVPKLPDIVWRELEQRGRRYGIPKLLIAAALLKTSPDGRSYSQRIDTLRTEKQLNALFEDMIAELPAGKTLFAGYNPVRTGGPMQVSIAFAEEFARERSYPYPVSHSIRDEVFSRRGGLYFGSAILLDYPAPYDDVVYRFADFNAGRYSSRNAAFQAAVARVSGKPLALDGDLLLYRDGKPQEQPSAVEGALQTLSGKLPLSLRDIRRDLLLEKSAGFGQSPLFAHLFVLAEQAAGSVLPRQTMPQIELKSPKFTRKLTTEWFARRVEGRYRTCLTRS
ncbi:MAG: DUF1615 domain-containing protein [Dechloromonas sp.]|nr:DUF1615 domain-containing protein [Dechloromonas sp.]